MTPLLRTEAKQFNLDFIRPGNHVLILCTSLKYLGGLSCSFYMLLSGYSVLINSVLQMQTITM